MKTKLLEELAEELMPYLMPYLNNRIKDELSSYQKEAIPNAKLLLTKKQVSERYNVSIQTLWRYEKEGKLIPVRMGRKVLYRPNDVERLFK